MIKASSGAEVRSLLAALSSNDGLRREAAIARLAVIGSRATDRLTAALSLADGRTRVGILRALEAIADPRALAAIADALQPRAGGSDCAVAAAGALKPLLEAADTQCAAAALDALVEAALDQSRERRVRLAAYAALQDIPPPLLAQVQAAFLASAGTLSGDQAVDEAVLADAFDGHLPDDPAPLRDAIAARGQTAPLSAVQKLIDAIRARERTVAAPASRATWLQARGAAHHALALRGSRVALYDLRETLEAADAPLPPSFLSALRVIGDASCVEPLAAALARSPESDLWWRHQLASALRAIAKRERITRRHATFRRAVARWPEAARAFS